MARCTHVTKSQKKIPESVCGIKGGIPEGSSYYWWKFRRGGKRFSLTPPKRSALTQSSFYATIFDIEDDMIEKANLDNIVSMVEEVKSALEELRDECQDNLDNTPESFQESSINNERVENLESMIDEIDNIDVSDESDENEKQEVLDALKAIDLSSIG